MIYAYYVVSQISKNSIKFNFQKLRNKKVVINRAVLDDNDLKEFATEAGINIFYVIPPLNDRELSDVIDGLLKKLGMIR